MKYTYLLALAGVAVAASTGFSQTTPITVLNPTFNFTATSTTDPLPGNGGGGPYYAVVGAAGSNPLYGWSATTGNNAIIDVIKPSTVPTPVAGQDATQDLELFENGGLTGALNAYQNTGSSFVAGDTYTLTADATTFSGSAFLPGTIFYIANSTGTVLASTAITGITAGTYSQFTVPFTSTGLLGDTGAIRIGVSAPNDTLAGNAFAEVDNFALTVTAPVPEPSSIAIAALGGFGLLGLVRRRRA